MQKSQPHDGDNSTIRADLHLHSCYSDGEYQPRRLIELAVQSGLEIISLTDHDSINGLPEAARAAEKYGCRLIPGVELEAFFETNQAAYSLHILGYNIDYTHPPLKQTLKKIHNTRKIRARKILDKLAALDVELAMENVMEFARGDSIGRVHIAQALLKSGFVENIEAAFDRYIGDHKPAYVPKDVHNPRQIIKLIHEAGGLAFWAHPCYTGNDTLIHPLKEMGLDGLECYHREFNSFQTRHYLELAHKHNLVVSGGSDFHGTLDEDFELGEWWLELPVSNPLISEKKLTLSSS